MCVGRAVTLFLSSKQSRRCSKEKLVVKVERWREKKMGKGREQASKQASANKCRVTDVHSLTYCGDVSESQGKVVTAAIFRRLRAVTAVTFREANKGFVSSHLPNNSKIAAPHFHVTNSNFTHSMSER